jgi:glycerol-3-phosphate acyltransferase PlsY
MCTAIDILASLAIGYAVGSIPVAICLFGSRKIPIYVKKAVVLQEQQTYLEFWAKKWLYWWLARCNQRYSRHFYITISLVPSFQFSGEFAALLAVIGHCFPVWLGFRGGKGVSTAFGATFVIARLSALAALIIFSLLTRHCPTS